MRRARPLLVVVALLASVGAASARPLDVPRGPAPDREAGDGDGDGAPAITAARSRRVSLGLSAVWLFLPMLRATAEVRLTRRLGLAVILGVGRATSVNNGGVHDAFVEGGSLRYYPMGRFEHGVQLGADLVKQAVPANSLKVEEPFPQGIALAPFVGFKHIYRVGFSFEAQLGVTYLISQKDVFPKAGDGEADARLGLLLNVNAGWSF